MSHPRPAPGLRSVVVAAMALAATGAAACATPLQAPGGPAADAGAATVTYVVDGDTIDVNVNGRSERVRLIGVDTPETVDRERPAQCFGAEATARLAELAPIGAEVRLERDEVSRDRYDRLLAYVWNDDDELVNLVLVEEGFGDAVTYGDNEALYDVLTAAESTARSEGRGLWGACAGPDEPITDEPVAGN